MRGKILAIVGATAALSLLGTAAYGHVLTQAAGADSLNAAIGSSVAVQKVQYVRRAAEHIQFGAFMARAGTMLCRPPYGTGGRITTTRPPPYPPLRWLFRLQLLQRQPLYLRLRLRQFLRHLITISRALSYCPSHHSERANDVSEYAHTCSHRSA